MFSCKLRRMGRFAQVLADEPSEPSGAQSGARRYARSPMHRAGSTPRLLLSLLAFAALAVGVALLSGCGSSGSSKQQTTTKAASAAKVDYKAEAVLSPATPEPPLKLRNYLGQPVNIDSYRGKPVLITFVYTHCPDVCPLMISNLRVAQNLMGSSGPQKAQVIAVSVDSRGDTPKTVKAFLKAHEMTGRMQYLIGSQQELARAFVAKHGWTFPVLRDGEGTVGNKYNLTGLPTTFVLDANGRIRSELRGPQTQATLAQAMAAVKRS
jgi:cytochrome oxidase Cu insertion factor (SCO1/SenC/PrrC family)